MTVVGVGIDLVDVARFSTILERRPSLTRRLFTEREQHDAAGRPERLAARFAAKEATLKALGVGLGAAKWHDMEVRRDASGAPTLVLSGAARDLAASCGATTWSVSLTHTSLSAGAIVIGEAS